MEIIHSKTSASSNDEKKSLDLLEYVLSMPLFAHLSTTDNGNPRESPLWFLWEDNSIWFIGHYYNDTFPKRLEANPACAVGVVHFKPDKGIVQHVGIRGYAYIEPHNLTKVKKLLCRYMGEEERWDSRFKAIIGDVNYILIKLVPETVVVRDQSYNLHM